MKRERKVFWLLMLFFVLNFFVVASRAWSVEWLNIGLLIPQEGNPLYLAKIKSACQFAIHETMPRGDSDVKFYFQFIEYPADAAKMKEVLKKDIKEKYINALVGGIADADSRIIAEVADDYSLPYISLASPPVVNKSKWVFYLQPPAPYYLEALKGFANEQIKAKTVAVLYEESPEGLALANYIKDAAAKNSWSLLAFGSYSKGSLDFRKFFNQLPNPNPDMLVMISLSSDAIFILRQAQELNINPKTFVGVGPAFSFSELAEPGIKESEYLFVLGPWVGSSKLKSSIKFAEAHEARYGYAATQLEAMIYSAVKILADSALKTESAAPKKVREALAAYKRDAPYGGELRFIEEGGSLNVNRSESTVAQWQKRKLLVVYPDKYQEAKPVLPTPNWKERK